MRTDEESGQTIIAGMGELHLEIIVDRMKREFGVEANVGKPQVAYRETDPQNGRPSEGKFVRQSGGGRPVVTSCSTIEPNEAGQGLSLSTPSWRRGAARIHPAVQKGVEEALTSGVLAGYPVVDVKVTLTFGSYHDVDSSEQAFQDGRHFGFKEGRGKATPSFWSP